MRTFLLSAVEIEQGENVRIEKSYFSKFIRSEVYDAEENETHVVVLKRPLSNDEISAKSIVREVAILSAIGSHENIIETIGVIEKDDGRNLYSTTLQISDNHHNSSGYDNSHHGSRFHSIMYQNLDNSCTLYDCIYTATKSNNNHNNNHNNNNTNDIFNVVGIEWNFFEVVFGIAQGLTHIHERGIIHRDIKSSNIIITSNGDVKIMNFGLGCFTNQIEDDNTYGYQGEFGTYRWMAPEMIRHEAYGTPVDIFSFAMVMFEMISNSLPHNQVDAIEAAFRNATNKRPDFPEDFDEPRIRAVIERAWHEEQTSRFTADEILEVFSMI